MGKRIFLGGEWAFCFLTFPRIKDVHLWELFLMHKFYLFGIWCQICAYKYNAKNEICLYVHICEFPQKLGKHLAIEWTAYLKRIFLPAAMLYLQCVFLQDSHNTTSPHFLLISCFFFCKHASVICRSSASEVFFPALQNFCSRRISSSNMNICWCTFVEYCTKASFWFWKWIVIHITMLSLIHNVRGGLLEISNEVDRLMWHASSSNSPKVPTAVKACCPWRADCIL